MNTAKVDPQLLLDRAVGVVLVSAAGDALGAGYEFGPPLSADTPVTMKGGGSFGWAPGEWTDDTQMALALLTTIAQQEHTPEAVEAAFRAWYDSGPADVGIQTRAVLGSTGSLSEAAARISAQRPDRSAGNGSLMRTGPVALIALGDRARIATYAAAVSELTHPDRDCVDACVLWSLAIDDAIRNAPGGAGAWDWVGSLLRGLDHIPSERRTRWSGLIEEAATGEPGDFPRNGWVVHAFQGAFTAILRCADSVTDPAAHVRLALETAVRAGGDTDTVAAIAGALLGARHGAAALDPAWRALLRGRRVYGEALLDAADLEELVRSTLVAP